jgi:glutamate/tyrosine decarboxylase-like PLP-dependent enzyme
MIRPLHPLLFDGEAQKDVLERASAIAHDYLQSVSEGPVCRPVAPNEVRAFVEALRFDAPRSPSEVLDHLAEGMRRYQVHVAHPRYFGLFNPAPATMAIAGDLLAAAFNPQLATWSHSPMACEVERYLQQEIGARFGQAAVEGTFASGGAEANHTALVVALAERFPEIARDGLRALPAEPVLYVSAESHHSFPKAARLCGLGDAAVRAIEVDASCRMIPEALEAHIAEDRVAGLLPFLVVATAGTTNAGAIDPLPDIATLAEREKLWFHVDAAWGGAAALVPELASLLAGIDRADSITFDAHKWLSVPMGAGLFLTRREGALARTFTTRAAYMPRPIVDAPDPYGQSMQWSRRFIGAKLYLTLAVAGWDGYAEALRHQVRMADRLRERLPDQGWRIANDTRLPIVCFDDPELSDERATTVASWIQRSGRAWISSTRLGRYEPRKARCVLRACVTHAGTGPDDIDALVDALARARRALGHA